MITKLENEYIAIKKQALECRESFIATLIRQAKGSNKTKFKEIRKREEMSNQQRTWKIASGNKLSVAVASVGVTIASEMVKIKINEETRQKEKQ